MSPSRTVRKSTPPTTQVIISRLITYQRLGEVINEVLVDVVRGIIAAVGSLDHVYRAALRANRVIPSLAVVVGQVDLQSGSVSFVSDAPELISDELAERLAARAEEHPLIEYWASGSGDAEDVVAISDLVEADQFTASEFYEACYAGTGIRDELRVPIPATSGTTSALIFCRAQPGFTEKEREHARLIGTVLAGCEGPSREIEALKEGRFTQARLRAHGLTVREAEIFALLAEGRRSQRVANELGISIRTVEKHTQSVYRQLGVTSRAEAMSLLINEPVNPTKLS